ncbi:MAG: dTDP-4-dehydrorhamnose reductase [Gammaproteobacteria bacterium]|nr:dTDP-4-dehydrorhamnose reductase [Gammaproteobacteria bacterium]
MIERHRILVTGARGQVGRELCRVLGPLGDVYASARRRTDIVYQGGAYQEGAYQDIDLDITCADAISRVFAEVRPHYVINAAAYTAVDDAEAAPLDAALVNAEAARYLVNACERYRTCLVHYSTDYVFDGDGSSPYTETARTAPLNVYGRTKREGELAVLASAIPHLVLRTGWVYAAHGRNFVRTMQRVARGNNAIQVVADQFGTPTWARSLAELTGLLLSKAISYGDAWLNDRQGLYHACAPDYTNWFELACAAIEVVAGPTRAAQVQPITTDEYPLPARRPAWSVMDSGALLTVFGLRLPPWRVQLAQMLADQEIMAA